MNALGESGRKWRGVPAILVAALVILVWGNAPAQVSTNARTGRFIRGYGTDEDVQSIVLALDFQKGVALDAIGGNGTNWRGGQPLTNTLFHYNATNPASATGTNGRIAYQTPIVAFGGRMGGSPLYVGTQYRFGTAPGVNLSGTNSPMFHMVVYDKRSNYTAIDTNSFWMPLTDQTNAWTQFATNGYVLSTNRWGLRTTIADHPGTRWALDNDSVTDSYLLTHEAVESSATNYLFEVCARGFFYLWDNEEYYAMSVDAMNGTNRTALYSVEFETRPTGRVLFIDQPHFRGEPLPPEYAGKSIEELTNFTATVTNHIWIATNANYLAVDQSPELRRHPILDKFIADMRYDPLALTEFVLNEIDLTDPLVFGNSNYVSADSVNLGGINRSALGTFLERQGSPWEQCALLVYLLRASGQWAAYVFPTNNNLKMLDTRLSKLLRMQLKGAIRENGEIFTSNSLITVNYPWVVANINSNRVVHIFPWLKDTEVVEGLNLYDYMPTNYDSGYRWAKQYMFGDTNIFSLSSEIDVPNVLFPKFIERTLLTNHPGISIDDLGVRTFNRRHSYARWEDLPRPTVLSNQTQVAVISNLVSVSNSLPWITSLFDTMRVRVWRGTTNLFDTGEMRTADLNARKFLLFTNDTKLNLWLAPYRPSITNLSLFTNDSALLNKQLLQTNVLAGDTNLLVSLTHLRHLWLMNQLKDSDSFELSESRTVSNAFTFSKADVAGICLDMGRVTTHMLEPHMEDYWREERKKQTNVNHVPLTEDFQGTAAYLIGMGFHEKKSRFKELNEGLHKVRELSVCGVGLGKLTTKLVSGTNKTQPGVDMVNSLLVLAANGTLRPDSGMDYTAGSESYRWMRAINSSAEEHAIINGAFRETNAISTVRLLQLAQRQSHSNRVGIVELHNYNYQTRGSQTSLGYPSGTTLSNYDVGMWAHVTNAFFNGDHPEYSTVFITPGSITNGSKSYVGMGAFIFEDSSDSSLIGNQNGGAGSYHPHWQALAAYHQWMLQAQRSRNEAIYFYYQYVDPTVGQSFASVPTAQVPTWFDGTWDIRPTPQQNNSANWVRILLNHLGYDYPQTVRAERDAGPFGDHVWLRDRTQWSSDPVNTLSGEFYIDAVDLTVPGMTPLQIRRNYLSQNRSPGQFGAGWKFSFTPHLVLTTNAQSVSLIYAAELEGSVIAYRLTNGVWLPVVTDNPGLNNNSAQGIGSLQNVFNARIVQTNNTNYVLTGADGTVRRYETRSYPIATNSAGALYRTRPYLVSWKDPQGNGYTFSYGQDQSRVDWGELVRIEASNGAFLVFDYDTYSRITTAWTGDGRRVSYDYDAYGDLIGVTLPDTSEIRYEYEHYPFTITNGPTITTNIDSKHLLVKELKPDGRVLQNEYDSQRRVTNQWATVGPDLRLVRNASFVYSNNFVFTNMPATGLSGYTLVKDAYDTTTRYDYTNGLLLKITDPLNLIVEHQWYTNNAVVPGYPRSLHKVKDKRGLWTEYKYDAFGNITNAVVTGDLTGNGNTSETATNVFSYNTNGLRNLLTSSTDAAGNKTERIYDTTFPYCPSQSIIYAGATPIITNQFEYYSVTNQVTNGTNVYTDIALGLLRREIRAYGSTDAATNEWLHNGRGYPTQSVQYTGTSDPAVTNFFAFNARGEQEEMMDGAGRKTRIDKDAMGRPILREVYEAGQTVPLSWEYSYYNENGELVWSDGPRFAPEDYVWRDYDGAGRKCVELRWRSQAKADGSGVEVPPGDAAFATTFYEYDSVGRLTRAIDPRGVITTNVYDTIDRRIRTVVLDANGSGLATNSFAYEPGGEVSFHTNALGGITETRYTTTGKPYYRTNANSSTVGWRYYRDGRQQKQFLSNSNYIETLYDDANLRVTNIFKTAGGTALATNIIQRDRRGNVIRTVDAAGFAFTNFFDLLNRPKGSAGPVIVYEPPVGAPPLPGGNPPNVQQTSAIYYGLAGQVVTNANPLGEKSVSYFDVLGRPTREEVRSAADALVREKTFAYAANHHSVTVTNGSGATALVRTTYSDNDGKPVLSVMYPSSGVLHFTLRDYDSAGNLESETVSSRTNSTVTNWTTSSFAYDNLNRVKSRIDKDGAETAFSYDAMGNITNRAMPSGLAWHASYNSAGQVVEDYDIAGSTGANTNTYLYYTNGGFSGLLQSKADGRGVTCSYAYDDFLRVNSAVHSGSSSNHNQTTIWNYDVRGFITNVSESFASSTSGPPTKVVRTFNAYGQARTESAFIGGLPEYGVMQSWDSAGRRTQIGFGTHGTSFGWRADGALVSATDPSGGGVYTYDTAGQLLTRSIGTSRTTTIAQRDGAGRSLVISNTITGAPKFTETLTWTGDGLPATDTMVRSGTGGFTDDRSYFYAPQSRRLIEERLNLDGTKRWTNTYAYDGGSANGAGVMTKGGIWSGATNALLRVASETNTARKIFALGDNNGEATVSAFLDGQPVPVTQIGTQKLEWRATLELTPGAHQLRAEALHPFMLYTASATNYFTNSGPSEIISNTYDGSGHVTSRIWKTGGTTNRTQTFVWDGRGRLLKTIERDSNQTGFDEIAVYDPLGRRIRLTNIPYTNNVAISNSIVTLDSIYDPEVEFLELGVAKNGDTVWKLYGPDLNGVYGGLNGLGGFEAIIPAAELFCPVISDALGNLHGIYDQGHAIFDWFSSRVTAFGAVPGYRPVPYAESTKLSLAHASAYRGKQGDANGTIALGARNLLWDAGVFLSTDPAGHGSPNENLYTAFNGRIDLFDPTGWGVTPSLGLLDRFPDAESWENHLRYIRELGQAQGLARQAHDEWLYARAYRIAATAAGYDAIAGYMFDAGVREGNREIARRNLEGVYQMPEPTWRDDLSYALDLTPGISTIKSIFQTPLGIDLITGNEVSRSWNAINVGLSLAPAGLFSRPATLGLRTELAFAGRTLMASAPRTATQLEFAFARGASVQTPGVTVAGETFVRVGATPQRLNFAFDGAGGTLPRTYAMPEATFNSLGRDPAALQNFLDLPGAAPVYYRYLRPPPGTPIQRGIVPGGEFGGVGGVPEVRFPRGF